MGYPCATLPNQPTRSSPVLHFSSVQRSGEEIVEHFFSLGNCFNFSEICIVSVLSLSHPFATK